MNNNENADRNGAPKAACCGGHSHASHSHHDHTATTARDPVCGMTVDPATSKHRFDYRGETYTTEWPLADEKGWKFFRLFEGTLAKSLVATAKERRSNAWSVAVEPS